MMPFLLGIYRFSKLMSGLDRPFEGNRITRISSGVEVPTQ